MTSRITEFDPPHMFVDEMVEGPFGAFRHQHRFEPGGTRMTDVVRFRMGWGLRGRLVDPFAAVYVRRLMVLRNNPISRKSEGTTR